MDTIKKNDGSSGTVYRQTAENVSEAAQELKSSTNEALKEVKRYCSEHPGKALALAAGAGAVVSLALAGVFRRDDSNSEEMISNLVRKVENAWSRIKNGGESLTRNAKESV